jgi:hypothetical protein
MLLTQEKGNLTPDRVIHYARNEKAALHESFEWDDTVAGHKYRIQQANALIRIHCVITRPVQRDVKMVVKVEPYTGKAAIVPQVEVVTDPFIEANAIWFQDGFLCCNTPNYPVRIPMHLVETFFKNRKVG